MNIKILLVSHRRFKIPNLKSFVPIHAGRSVCTELSKDGKISQSEYDWLLKNTIGDNDGENISNRNRLYSECSTLYWAWKNYDKLGNPDYIGLMHYRRHFILNDNYSSQHKKDKWENALAFVNEMFINEDYLARIGLTDENIKRECEKYDLIVSKDANLELINGRNIREDYIHTISGVDVKDFDRMVEIIKSKYPEYTQALELNINGYKKTLYQMFIMKKELFFEYCEFLFGVLFELEKEIDFSKYSTNGKRTLGYLAEILLSIFVWKNKHRSISKRLVTFVEFPYEKEELKRMLSEKPPSYVEYLRLKIKSFFLTGVEKMNCIECSRSIRSKRKSYKKLRGAICQKLL